MRAQNKQIINLRNMPRRRRPPKRTVYIRVYIAIYVQIYTSRCCPLAAAWIVASSKSRKSCQRFYLKSHLGSFSDREWTIAIDLMYPFTMCPISGKHLAGVPHTTNTHTQHTQNCKWSTSKNMFFCAELIDSRRVEYFIFSYAKLCVLNSHWSETFYELWSGGEEDLQGLPRTSWDWDCDCLPIKWRAKTISKTQFKLCQVSTYSSLSLCGPKPLDRCYGCCCPAIVMIYGIPNRLALNYVNLTPQNCRL